MCVETLDWFLTSRLAGRFPRRLDTVPVESPLAKIGNALRTKAMAWHAVEAGRFRFGGEKEAAGVCRGRGDLALPYGD